MTIQSSQGILSPFLQSQRLQAARPHIRGAVLDIGCADGALARYCDRNSYLGVDIENRAIETARAKNIGYRFEADLPEAAASFDTVAALAVIEHLPDPASALSAWAKYLKPGGQIVLTTPLPALEWAHELGAKVGLFSHDAAEEHEVLLDEKALRARLEGTSLRIKISKKFLGGANQLFVLEQLVQ